MFIAQSLFDNLSGLDSVPDGIRNSAVRFLVAIGVIILLWLLRHLITGLIVRPIRERVADTDSETDDAIFNAIDGSITWLVMGLGVLIATPILGLAAGAIQIGVQLGGSLLAVAVFKALYELSSYLTGNPERIHRFLRIDVDKPLIPIIRVALQVLVALSGIFVVANIWGVNLTGLLTGLGIGGLALSLAAKEVLDDVLGYMVIMSDDLFKLDEHIVSPHAEGVVEHIGIRSTRIRRLDQGLAIVPNSVITSEEIVNWSRLERRWFNFMLGLQYDTPAEKIEEFTVAVHDMLAGREAVDEDSIVVLFTQYDDSSLNLLVRSYVNIEDWTESKQERHAVNLEIARLAAELDINLAFPSRSLYLERMPKGFTGMIEETYPESGSRASSRNGESDTAHAHHNYADSDQNSDVEEGAVQKGDAEHADG